MNIYLERIFQTEFEINEISNNLKEWAKAQGFILTIESENKWELKRGSSLECLFDIKTFFGSYNFRKIPTKVVVSLSGDHGKVLNCSMRAKTHLLWATTSELENFSMEFDILVKYLKGTSKNDKEYAFQQKDKNEISDTNIKLIHSKAGIISFIMSITMALSILLFFILFIIRENDFLWSAIYYMLCIEVFALWLSIYDVLQQNRKKIFAILGIIFSSITLLGAIVFVVVILVAYYLK